MEIINDGQWVSGLDSISYTLAQGSYAWGQNVVNRGGILETRQGFAEIAAVAQRDPRGLGVITIGGVTWLLAAIGNYIYKLNVNDPKDGLKRINKSNGEPALFCRAYDEPVPPNPAPPIPVRNRMVHFELCVQAQKTEQLENGGYNTKQVTPPKFVVIIQDGVSPAQFWDPSETVDAKMAGPIDEHPDYIPTKPHNTPTGTFMKWVGDRLWVVTGGKKVRASNLLNPFQFTEETVTASGGAFFLPDNATGMGVTHDYKALLVFTHFTTTAFQVGIELRSQWSQTQDFQRVIFPSIGCASHRTIINMYGMTWWMSHDGLLGLDNAMAAYQTTRLDIKDLNMVRSRQGINWTTGGGASGSFGNFLFFSVPSASKWNQHTWVMDQAPISLLAGTSAPSWCANWTGVRPEQWITCQIAGQQRCFFISRDLTNEGHQSTIWEAFIGQRMDVPKVGDDRKARDIGCAFESRFLGLSPSQYCKLRWIELDVAEIVGDVALHVYYCGRRTSYKQIINTHLTSTVSNVTEEVFNPDDPIPVNVPQYRTIRSSTDTHNAADIDPEVQTPYVRYKDREFSVLVQWSGQMAVSGVRMAVDPDPDYMEGLDFPDEYLKRTITAEGDGGIGCILPPANAPNGQLTSKFLSPTKPRWVEFPAYDSAVPNGVFFVSELFAVPPPRPYPSSAYPINVTLSSETEGIDIYYTLNNTIPRGPPNPHGILLGPRNERWETADIMAYARSEFTSTVLSGGRILVAGGKSTGGVHLKRSEIFDPATSTWSATGSLTTGRIQHAASLMNDGRVMACGGAGVLKSAEIYFAPAGIWSPTDDMNTPRKFHTATKLDNGKILVVGGFNLHPLASAELYDPVLGTWTATDTMNSPRYLHTATLLPGGRVLVSGGLNDSGILNTAEIWDPLSFTWFNTGSMAGRRRSHTSTLTSAGVLVAGGTGTGSGSGEMYDVSDGTWSSAGSLAVSRSNHSAMVLPNDVRVLITGGIHGSQHIATAEVFNPSTFTWSSAGNFVGARANHESAPISDGRVLIIGGENGAQPPVPLATTDLYIPSEHPVVFINETLKAIGVRQGLRDSVLFTGKYTQSKVADVVFDPSPGGFPPDEFFHDPPAYTGPVAAYNFNEGTGTIVHDSSPHHLNGTTSNITWNPTGKHGKAINFNGSSSWINLQSPQGLKFTGSMTLSAWVNVTEFPPFAGANMIVGRSNLGSGWSLYTDDFGHGVVSVSGAAGTFAKRASAVIIPRNTWMHVTGVYKASAATLDVYINGVLSNGTLTGTVPHTQVVPPINVNIGRRGDNVYFFHGILDDIRIYNVAITPSKIIEDYNNQVLPPTPNPAGFAVTMSTETADSDIHFVTDRPPYDPPPVHQVTINDPTYDPAHPPHPHEGEIIRAKAFRQYYLDSDQTNGLYFPEPRCVTPTFHPDGGQYPAGNYPQRITVASGTEGSQLRVKINDSDVEHGVIKPNPSFITVNADDTLRVIAQKSGLSDSLVKQATYTVRPDQVATPVLDPSGVVLDNNIHQQRVHVVCSTPNVAIRWKLGEIFDTSPPVVGQPGTNVILSNDAFIDVGPDPPGYIGHVALKVIAYRQDMIDSVMVTGTYNYHHEGGG